MIALEKLFTLLPPVQLERLATTYQLDRQNSVKLSGPVVFLCVLNGLLNHNELTLQLLAETYLQQTGDTADYSSFSKCLARISPDYFAEVFGYIRQKLVPSAQPSALQALRLRFVDATTVTLSAKLLQFGLLVGTRSQDKPRRHVKSVVELTDRLPNLLRLCKDKSENADSVALGETMQKHSQPGDLWIFDKGCHGRQRLLSIHEAHAFFLTPHSQQKLRIDRVLLETDPATWPNQPPQEGEPDFVLVRVEQGIFENSQSTQNQKWQAMPLVLVEGVRFDPRTKTWKSLTLMTNLPLSAEGQKVGPFTVLELTQVYRQRWEIEVFFKFVKQHLSVSHLTSRCENGIQVMLYMALSAALLLIWYQEQTGIDRGWRSVKFWLAENVRLWTQELVQTLQFVPDG
jgi:hypothetical protein